METTVLLEAQEAFEADTVGMDDDSEMEEEESDRPGLTIFTDESRLDCGTPGHAVAWPTGERWVVITRSTWVSTKKRTMHTQPWSCPVNRKASSLPERFTIVIDA
jgi:hypothetical protein